ncbi:MAG: hypothetical protein HY423_09145, partial [Candidatus Lambdaproteobacteria bacterium]|nr:hypothetical protein [Candidatus Lambdaproteobacteria bacterium]
RAEALGSYDVLPASASVPPSSVAAQAGPFRTSLRGRDRFAMGLAFARSSTESLLFGVATDESAVRTDDAVFRRVDIGTLGLGYSRSLGRASFTWGLVYQFTLGRPVQLPMRNDEGSREERLSLESLQLRLGASVFL